MTDTPDEITGTIGPLRYRFGHESGDLFEEGDDFDGLTLTIEVRHAIEAMNLVRLIREEWNP